MTADQLKEDKKYTFVEMEDIGEKRNYTDRPQL